MSENFSKVLDMWDKDSIIDIVERFYLPKAGKKEKHIERIIKNYTILEYAIKTLVNESNKGELIDISEELGMESEGSVSELKQQILQKLNKTINEKDLKNKIKFLNICFDKDGLFEILENYNMPKTGKKEKLMESLAKNDIMMEYALNICKGQYKDEIEDNCESLGIDSDGSKEKLVERIRDYLFKKQSSKVIQKESPVKKSQTNTESSKNIEDISEDDLQDKFAKFSWRDMEEIVGKLFEKKGYSVEVSPASKDYGIDVWATNSDEKVAIQVKHYEKNVDYDALTKTVGVTVGKSNRAIVISTKTGFTNQCYEYYMHNKYLVEYGIH